MKGLGFELALVREERLQGPCHARCTNDLALAAAQKSSGAPDPRVPLAD
jgi:hypothetical protein